MRHSLPAVLILLLALIGGTPAVRSAAGPVAPAASAVVATVRSSTTTAADSAPAETAATVAATDADVLPGCERVLRTQLVLAVRAARAPPA